MIQTRQAANRYAVGGPRRAGPVSQGGVIPFDYAAPFRLRGVPGNLVQGVINIGSDGTFVATAIGYGLEEDRARTLHLPLIGPDQTFKLGDIKLSDLPSDALVEGFRSKPALPIGEAGVTATGLSLDSIVAQQSRDTLLERMHPQSDISFFLSMVDSSSGRELQDEPVHNLASLGKSNGERPFRLLPHPLSFAPRSTLRLQVIENSEGVQGTLFIVLYGYKMLAPSHCPEPIVRRLRGAPGCEGEVIGLPSMGIVPFDYVANIELLGIPQRIVQQEVNVSVEGGFVATALGYALATEDPRVRIASAIVSQGRAKPGKPPVVDLNALPLSVFGIQAVRNGFRIRPGLLRIVLRDGGGLTSRLALDLADKIFEPLDRAEDVSFRYTIVDGGTGRELQNGLINNIAGLGIANGDRPFKTFARPMIFAPRSSIRVIVQEHFGRGRLFMTFQGYKLDGASVARGRR